MQSRRLVADLASFPMSARLLLGWALAYTSTAALGRLLAPVLRHVGRTGRSVASPAPSRVPTDHALNVARRNAHGRSALPESPFAATARGVLGQPKPAAPSNNGGTMSDARWGDGRTRDDFGCCVGRSTLLVVDSRPASALRNPSTNTNRHESPFWGSSMDFVDRGDDGPEPISVARCRELLGDEVETLTNGSGHGDDLSARRDDGADRGPDVCGEPSDSG